MRYLVFFITVRRLLALGQLKSKIFFLILSQLSFWSSVYIYIYICYAQYGSISCLLYPWMFYWIFEKVNIRRLLSTVHTNGLNGTLQHLSNLHWEQCNWFDCECMIVCGDKFQMRQCRSRKIGFAGLSINFWMLNIKPFYFLISIFGPALMKLPFLKVFIKHVLFGV